MSSWPIKILYLIAGSSKNPSSSLENYLSLLWSISINYLDQTYTKIDKDTFVHPGTILLIKFTVFTASDRECFGTNRILPGNTHTWHVASIASTRDDGVRREKKEEDVLEERRGVEGYL